MELRIPEGDAQAGRHRAPGECGRSHEGDPAELGISNRQGTAF